MSTVAVPAALDPTGTHDSTDLLAGWLNSLPAGATVTLPARARYRLDRPLVITRTDGLTVHGNGAVLRQGVERTTAAAPIVELLGVRGHRWHDVHVEGIRPDGAAYDRTREGQHGWRLTAVTDVHLPGCRARNVWGDAFYLGGRTGRPSELVWLPDVHAVEAGRHAIAATGARGVVIERAYVARPQRAVLDLEPNGLLPVENVHLLASAVCGGGRLLFVPMRGGPDVNRVRIADNVLVGEHLQIDCDPGVGYRRRRFIVERNVADAGPVGGKAIRFARCDDVRVTGNAQACKAGATFVELEDCTNVHVAGNDCPGAITETRVVGEGGPVPLTGASGFTLPEPAIPGRS